MSRLLKGLLPIILFSTFLLLACKKTTVEPNVLTQAVLSPPPPSSLGTCNIKDGGEFLGWFGLPAGYGSGELWMELSGSAVTPNNFIYDASNIPTTCAGLSPGAYYFEYYNSNFN